MALDSGASADGNLLPLQLTITAPLPWQWRFISLSFLVVSLGLYFAAHADRRERHVRRLGGRARAVKTVLPFGLDFLYKNLRRSRKGQNLLVWCNVMQHSIERNQSQTVEVSVGGESRIFTADPENVKAVLATQFAHYGKGPQFNAIFHDLLGNSIFTTDGQQWKASRAIVRNEFVKERLSDAELFDRHTSVFLETLGWAGDPTDIRSVVLNLTLDVSTEFLLGTSAGAQRCPNNAFSAAFAATQRIQTVRIKLGGFSALYPRAELRRHLRVFNAFIEPFVDQALALPIEKCDAGDESKYTFLRAIAAHTRDRSLLRDQIAAVLIAGRDTTASALTWLLYELAFAPHVVAAIRAEIIHQIGLDKQPTFADLKSMRTLQHAINETLRLYPSIPVNIRVALEDSSLPRGGGSDGQDPVGIPAGTQIIYSTHYMHLTESNYPSDADFPDPAIFEPSRWDTWRPQNFTYIPFNAGPRLCAGQQFALTEIGFVVVRLLQRFSRLEPSEILRKRNPREPPPIGSCPLPERVYRSRIQMKTDIVLQPAEPIDIHFIR